MFLYSIASGVSVAGIVLLLIVAMTTYVITSVSGSVMNIFRNIEWNIAFLALCGIVYTTWGLVTVISMGYQQVDLFVTFISLVVSFFSAVIIGAIIKGLSERASMKKYWRQRR